MLPLDGLPRTIRAGAGLLILLQGQFREAALRGITASDVPRRRRKTKIFCADDMPLEERRAAAEATSVARDLGEPFSIRVVQ